MGTRTTLTALAALTLLGACAGIAPCEGEVCYGTEPMEYQPGQVVTLDGPGYLHPGPFLVRVMTLSDSMALCAKSAGVALSLPAGCTYWRIPEKHGEGLQSTKDGNIIMPAGYSCVVVTPNIRWVYEHEIRHCLAGNFH